VHTWDETQELTTKSSPRKTQKRGDRQKKGKQAEKRERTVDGGGIKGGAGGTATATKGGKGQNSVQRSQTQWGLSRKCEKEEPVEEKTISLVQNKKTGPKTRRHEKPKGRGEVVLQDQVLNSRQGRKHRSELKESKKSEKGKTIGDTRG